MTSSADRQEITEKVKAARFKGARWKSIAETVGISERTLRSWCSKKNGGEDLRPSTPRKQPQTALSNDERKLILDYCNSPEYASLPPEVIVPSLLDKGVYIASESSFYRVLREAKQVRHRGKAKSPVKRAVPRHDTSRPNGLWSWDITYLRGPIKGSFYYLYLIMDVFSRKIVGWEVYDEEKSELAAELLEKAILKEGIAAKPPILHSDNGAPMKGFELREKMNDLDVTPSYSRPRVSNDNPFSESLFGTIKMRPNFPENGFATIEEAREWVADFEHYYNYHHKHSSINYVTPDERHVGEDAVILAKRNNMIKAAYAKNPARWSGKTRVYQQEETVWINKPDDFVEAEAKQEVNS